jgi:hypothetical protein
MVDSLSQRLLLGAALLLTAAPTVAASSPDDDEAAPCPAKPCPAHPGRTYCPSVDTPGQCDEASHPSCPPCVPPPPPPPPPSSADVFSFAVDWSSGGAATTLPAPTFAVRKLEAFVWPKDNRTYAYGDIVNYSDPFYPVSYSSEVGVFSSTDGLTGWKYHGIAVGRGKPGSWDGAGIASPGAASTADGTVLVGYCGENAPTGGINRGIGLASAPVRRCTDCTVAPFPHTATPTYIQRIHYCRSD